MTSRFTGRRGVSETIGTMMILVITVLGAVMISNAMQNSIFPVDQGTKSFDIQPQSIQLIGYDTRDSVNLSDVTTLSNNFDQLLCTDSCKAQDNLAPDLGGTEFLVLHIRNTNVNPISLHNILINNEGHSWDAATAGVDLDASIDVPTSGEFPADGKFSIIPITNGTASTIKQKDTIQLGADEEVRAIIKLSDKIPQDIGMWDSLRILVNYGGTQPAEFIVLSGDAKW